MKHLLASLPILASLASPANCQPDPAMLFHERPGTCRGTSLEAGDGAVGRDEALCGSDAREAWALGISARGLFGLWRGMELVAAFSEGAETLAVRGGGGIASRRWARRTSSARMGGRMRRRGVGRERQRRLGGRTGVPSGGGGVRAAQRGASHGWTLPQALAGDPVGIRGRVGLARMPADAAVG